MKSALVCKKYQFITDDFPIAGKSKKGDFTTTVFNTSLSGVKSSGGIADNSPFKLFRPVVVLTNPEDVNLGQELAGTNIDRSQLMVTLNNFFQSDITKSLSREQGLDDFLYRQACISFRKYCLDVQYLPPELYILFSDILQGAVHYDSIFPYFLKHAKRVFPHLECLDELKMISDLTDPPNWYPEARSINRKVRCQDFKVYFLSV